MWGLRGSSALATVLAAMSVACGASGSRAVVPSAPSAPEPAAAPAVPAKESAPSDAALVVVRLSAGVAHVPGMVEVLAPAREQVQVQVQGGELVTLEGLHDDTRAAAVYSAQQPGVFVSGTLARVELVARLASFAHGGEAPNPPPLAAIRVTTFEGLDASQVGAMINLAVSTTLVEERQWDDETASSARLASALGRALVVAQDRRASRDCRAPCQPWPWQTLWSVLTTLSRAEWRLGARLRDPAVLSQSEQLARRALSVVPAEAHPLTTAVSERLLGAVLHSIGDVTGDDAAFGQSLAADQRALDGFGAPLQRYDWALTQKNLQATLQARMARSSSPLAASGALAASEQVLSVIDQRTPKLRAQALVERAQLLRAKWARSGEQQQLTEAARVLQEAAGLSGSGAEPLAITVALSRCDLESELASKREDIQSLRQAVARCDALPDLPSLPASTAAEAHRSYGLSLGRLAAAVGDAETMSRAVEQLERALEAFGRIEGKRAGAKVRADYAWGLLELGHLSPSLETTRKAASVSEETLELISKQAAPLQWSQMKQLQGLALIELGWKMRANFRMEFAATLYQQSRAAFIDALSNFSKGDNPRRWGVLQRWLGQTYRREYESTDAAQRIALFNQALASFQRALTVSHLEDDPDAFAHTQLGLGSTYLVQADQAVFKRARDAARRSEAAFRLALGAFQQLGAVQYIAHTKAHLADALDILQRPQGPCEALQLRLEAVSAYPNARGLWTSAQTDLDGFNRSRLDPSRCPQLPASFWQSSQALKKP